MCANFHLKHSCLAHTCADDLLNVRLDSWTKLTHCHSKSALQAKGLLPPEVLDTQVDPAAFELSGHLVLKRAEDFDTVTQVCSPASNHCCRHCCCCRERSLYATGCLCC